MPLNAACASCGVLVDPLRYACERCLAAVCVGDLRGGLGHDFFHEDRDGHPCGPVRPMWIALGKSETRFLLEDEERREESRKKAREMVKERMKKR